MDAVIKRIDYLQNLMFTRETAALKKELIGFTDELIPLLSMLNEEQTRVINEILSLLNIALSNQDYLLMADLLEYEMKSFLSNHLCERNIN
ncbi:MAG TPA: hypothetical protein DD791_02310 [Syntrophomonas sp.]|jgi:hypothetical protein|nr:hypothetical protein [Syntrophomonas sp.]